VARNKPARRQRTRRRLYDDVLYDDVSSTGVTSSKCTVVVCVDLLLHTLDGVARSTGYDENGRNLREILQEIKRL